MGSVEKQPETDQLAREVDFECDFSAGDSGAVERVRRGLAKLRVADSPAQLLQRAARELVVSCGFERVMISRLASSTLVATAWHSSGDPAKLERQLRVWREHPPGINHLVLEGEMIRRRRGALIRNAQTHPLTYKPVLRALGSESYVAAPFTPGAQVAGMIHADGPVGGVDELDCAVLSAFAEGLSLALERSMMAERVRLHEQRLRAFLGQADGLLDELVDSTFDLIVSFPESGGGGEALSVRRQPAGAHIPMGVLSLLTRREIEVLDMMATGATNRAIAETLVISEVTVKSHVQHILRKLRATNRAEAAARYVRLRHGA